MLFLLSCIESDCGGNGLRPRSDLCAARRRIFVAAATALAVCCAVLATALRHGPTAALLRRPASPAASPVPPAINITMCTQVRSAVIDMMGPRLLGPGAHN